MTKHLATSNRVQIVPPVETTAVNINTFMLDGSYVYYTMRDERNPQGRL